MLTAQPYPNAAQVIERQDMRASAYRAGADATDAVTDLAVALVNLATYENNLQDRIDLLTAALKFNEMAQQLARWRTFNADWAP